MSVDTLVDEHGVVVERVTDTALSDSTNGQYVDEAAEAVPGCDVGVIPNGVEDVDKHPRGPGQIGGPVEAKAGPNSLISNAILPLICSCRSRHRCPPTHLDSMP